VLRYSIVKVREVKEHYSDVIEHELLNMLERGRVKILIAGAGTGKSFAGVSLAVKLSSREYVSKYLPGIARGFGKPAAVFFFEPYHPALSSVAEKVKKVYEEIIFGRALFTAPPTVAIIRGAHASCINEDVRRLVNEIIKDVIGRQLGLDAKKGYELRWRINRAEIKNLDMLMDLLSEYSYYSYLEQLFGYVCAMCPLNKTKIEVKGQKCDAVQLVFEALAKRGVMIVDSIAPKERELLNMLHQWGIISEDLCIYKLLFRYALYEPHYRQLHGRRGILFCMTYAMLFNPVVHEMLEHRFRIVTRVRLYAKHLHIYDEVDTPLLSPHFARLPIHFSPIVGKVTPDLVEEVVKKYTSSTYIGDLRKVVNLASDLYMKIHDACASARRISDKVQAITDAVHRWLLEKFANKERALDLIKRAEKCLLAWRRVLMRQLSDMTVDPDHLVLYLLCEHAVKFFKYILKFDLHLLPRDKLANILSYGVGIDVKSSIFVRPNTVLDVTFIDVSELAIALYDPIVRFLLTNAAPYRVMCKLGITATFGPELLKGIARHYLTESTIKLLESEPVECRELRIKYVNVKFYKACMWIGGAMYRRAVDTIESRKFYGTELFKLAYSLRTDYDISGLPRKQILSMSSTIPQLIGVVLPDGKVIEGKRGCDVILNLVHELYYIARKEKPNKTVFTVLVFVGTSPQLDALARSAGDLEKIQQVLPDKSIVHGALKIKIKYDGWLRLSETSRLDDAIRIIAEAQPTYGEGTKIRFIIDMTYARSSSSRGVDLEYYDIAVMLSPPLTPPSDLHGVYVMSRVGNIPVLSKEVMMASYVTCQCLFRTIRRAVYSEPKIIVMDVSLCCPKYSQYYVGWFRECLESRFVGVTPLVALLEERIPDKYIS